MDLIAQREGRFLLACFNSGEYCRIRRAASDSLSGIRKRRDPSVAAPVSPAERRFTGMWMREILGSSPSSSW